MKKLFYALFLCFLTTQVIHPQNFSDDPDKNVYLLVRGDDIGFHMRPMLRVLNPIKMALNLIRAMLTTGEISAGYIRFTPG